ncbi:MAG TPA: hypothetical protein PKJ12_13910 [Ottowia sp.]|nr:hypothetical protein [Ottowia sp.]HNI84423.1 hypothetical protein [Ottowia sp.]HNK54268.1 hypothetical protein [Ottowia sp.]HNL42703.1 hypothetical protein [Ottowia sp.]HNN33095.1 hypothetical protein [Ottowia sp.]
MTLTVKSPPDLEQSLGQQSAAEGRSLSELWRDALTADLASARHAHGDEVLAHKRACRIARRFARMPLNPAGASRADAAARRGLRRILGIDAACIVRRDSRGRPLPNLLSS